MITTILLITATLLLQTCNKPTEPAKESISVTVEDVSCTEAWLKISDTNANPSITVIVKRDDTDILTLNLNKADTVIIDENLLPNKTYKYRAVKQQGSNIVEASKPVTAVTLDTTSHNFTWQTFEFGEHSSSTLYDVAIIDENNIWAVGEIYMKDSLGNYDPHAYNAVHWDGQQWELKRIMFYTICGQTSLSSYPAKAIFTFSENDIWIAGGGRQLARINGTNQFDKICLPFSMVINKLWGSSSNDLYAVGNGGNIAHWNGSSWKKIESGTTLNLFDIHSYNGNDVFISGGSFNDLKGIILKKDSKGLNIIKEGRNISKEEIFNPYFAGIAKTIWEGRNHKILFGGNLLYRYNLGIVGFVKSLPGNDFGQNVHGEHWGFISMIRGNDDNDLIMVGEGNTMRHFNGKTWCQLGLPYNINSEYSWLSVEMKDNLIVAVGRSTSKSIIIKLKRYN